MFSQNRNLMKNAEMWNDIPMEMRPKIRFWFPAAAMDVDDLKSEIENLYIRGFGGIEAVVLNTGLDSCILSEDGWGTAKWDKFVHVLADETEKRNMSFDLAISPEWPISVPGIKNADDPAVLYELTYGCDEAASEEHYIKTIPKGRHRHEEGTPVLLHLMAYHEIADHVLRKESYLDLRKYIKKNNKEQILDFHFPEITIGKWVIFAFYQQPSIQKRNAEQNYVINHINREGMQACADYWKKFMHEKDYLSLESFFCDSLEYEVSMEWSPEFLKEFEVRRGYSLLPYLPVIGVKNTYPVCDIPGYRFYQQDCSDMINRDYMETLTQCYCEYHLAGLEKMAESFGKTVRYQVAYNKPLEIERSALYVAIPENEALGRAAIDGMKTMAAGAHLGRKKRYSFESAAEFGHSYGQSYEDLFWWVKRSYMAGMNAQVLHGASYSGKYEGKYSENGQIPGVKWPGHEAFGKFVSNYWNRTLSIEDARGCMDALARMNVVFRKQAKVDCAIYRCEYVNDGTGSEFCYYPDDGLLAKQGYSYEFLSESLLNLSVCTVKNGRLDRDGIGYKCLIIPEQKNISLSALLQIRKLAQSGLQIIWAGERPVCSMFYAEWESEEKRSRWKSVMNMVWKLPEICHVENLQQVPSCLRERDILPEICLDGQMNLMTAVRIDAENKKKYYAVYGYNCVEYQPGDSTHEELSVSAIFRKGTTKGTYQRPGSISRKRVLIKLKGSGEVFLCDPWSGKKRMLDFMKDEHGYMSGWVNIEEDELLIFELNEADMGEYCFEEAEKLKKLKAENTEIIYPLIFESLELEEFEPNTSQEVSFLRSGYHGKKKIIQLKKLLPWDILNEELKHFAGYGIYSGYVLVEKLKKNNRYILELGEVSDTFQVYVNDQKTLFPDQVMKRVDVTGYLREGRNSIKVKVTSNLYNKLFDQGMVVNGIELPYHPRKYGIWETEYKKVCLKVYRK